jgi:hypothetical protein
MPVIGPWRTSYPFLVGFLVLGLAALPACAATGEGGGAAGGNRNLLTLEDVDVAAAQDVYQLVQRHRSAWLRPRGSAGTAIVYLNGQRRGDVDTLREISASDFFQARYLDSREATSLHGTGHGAGVIAVETRRR